MKEAGLPISLQSPLHFLLLALVPSKVTLRSPQGECDVQGPVFGKLLLDLVLTGLSEETPQLLLEPSQGKFFPSLSHFNSVSSPNFISAPISSVWASKAATYSKPQTL